MRSQSPGHLMARAPALDLAWASAQMFGSRALGHGASFLVAVVVARDLGPGALGLYSFALVVATLLSDVPGAGLDMCAVRLSARDSKPLRLALYVLHDEGHRHFPGNVVPDFRPR